MGKGRKTVEYIHNHVNVVSTWGLISLGTCEKEYKTLVRLVPPTSEKLGYLSTDSLSSLPGNWACLVLELSPRTPSVESQVVDEESP